MIIWTSMHWKFPDVGLIPTWCKTNEKKDDFYTFALNGLELLPSHPVIVNIENQLSHHF